MSCKWLLCGVPPLAQSTHSAIGNRVWWVFGGVLQIASRKVRVPFIVSGGALGDSARGRRTRSESRQGRSFHANLRAVENSVHACVSGGARSSKSAMAGLVRESPVAMNLYRVA